MKAMLIPALSTFIAAIMVACSVLVIATTLRLGETQRQLRHQHKITGAQARQIRGLTKVAYAQEDLLSIHQKIIGRLAKNQQQMYSLLAKRMLVAR